MSVVGRLPIGRLRDDSRRWSTDRGRQSASRPKHRDRNPRVTPEPEHEQSSSILRLGEMARDMHAKGVRRIHVLAWRDLDDPDAGGSEIHADEFMSRWQEAGFEVLQRTSRAEGRPSTGMRHGYRVIRRGGRFDVFPRTIIDELIGRMGPYDAVVEIWNGVPWFTPLWCRKPRLVILHHVHEHMWEQTLPTPAAWFGRRLETSWAPLMYRNTETVTLCADSQQDLLRLGWRSNRLHVAHAGVDPYFSPGGEKTPFPSAVAVGRLAPVKRFVELLEQCARIHKSLPNFRLTIVGEGPERPRLEHWIAENEARTWVHLVGRVERERLRTLYRESWLVMSASLAEGWGLTLTEAAGCGTPSVVTDIGGHRSAVQNGVTGLLGPLGELSELGLSLLTDDIRRTTMGRAASDWARSLSWDDLAENVLRPLHAEVMLR